MADNTIQLGLTVDASTVSPSLSQVQSAFQDTTSSVASQWTEASSSVTVSLKKIADEAENSAGRTKAQIDKASSAASALGDVVGIKVPDGMQKMLAESELIGPVLEKAFAPLAVIQLGQWIAQAADQLTKFISDTFIFTQADKDAVAQIVSENRALADLANKAKEAARAKQLLDAPDQASKDKLKLQFQIEDQGGSAADFRKKINDANKEINEELIPQSRETAKAVEQFGELTSEVEEYTKAALDATARIQQLRTSMEMWHHQEKAAQAEEALQSDQIQKDKATAAAAAQQRRSQAFMKGLQDQLAAEKQTQLVSIEEERNFWQSKLAAAAKYPEVYRTIQTTIGNIDQQLFQERAAFDQKLAEESRETAEKAANEQVALAMRIAHDRIRAMLKTRDEAIKLATATVNVEIAEARRGEAQQEAAIEHLLAHHKITKAQEVQQVADAKVKELQLEIQYLQQLQRMYSQDSVEWQNLQKRITDIEKEQIKVRTKAEADGAKATDQTYKQLWSSIGSTFKSMVNGLIQGNETIAQAFQKLYTGLLQDLINFYAQKEEKELASLLQSLIFQKTGAAAQIGASAGKGFAAAYADMASLGPQGLAAAPGVASATSTSILAGGLAQLTELDVGTWNVPSAMPAFLHPGEIVMPAFESNMFRNMAKSISPSGGHSLTSGSPVHVHFHVNAIDGADAASFIQKNANNITNVLYKQMRKKGLQVG
jgi:hypothetical protein